MGNWISERWTVIKEAAAERRYVFGIIVATVVGAFDWIEQWLQDLIGQWSGLRSSIPDATTVIGIPSWTVGIIVAFAFLCWWTIDYAVQLRRRLNPGIKITFEGAAPFVHPVPAHTPSRDDPNKIVITDSIFVRFQVVNTTPGTVVRGCEAFLSKASRKNENGEFVQISSGDSFRLPWAAKPKDKIHAEISIPYGISTFCDLLSVDKEHNQLFVKWDVHLNANLGIFDDTGIFKFDVVAISAKGGPVTKSIFVDWPGEWHRINAWSHTPPHVEEED